MRQKLWRWRGWNLMLTWGQSFGLGVFMPGTMRAVRVNGIDILIGPLNIDIIPPEPAWLRDAVRRESAK